MYGGDDGQPYFWKSSTSSGASTLSAVMSSMSTQTANARMRRIKADDYKYMPYMSEDAFVSDVATLCKLHPQDMRRIVDKKTTIFSSLQYSTAPAMLGYLMNLPRYIARNPHAQTMFGTTGNEAFHNQLKGWFRNVFFQTARNAELVCQVATSAKLLAGTLQQCRMTSALREHESMGMSLATMAQQQIVWTPRMVCATVANPKVDQDSLPVGVKRIRKRPAGN